MVAGGTRGRIGGGSGVRISASQEGLIEFRADFRVVSDEATIASHLAETSGSDSGGFKLGAEVGF